MTIKQLKDGNTLTLKIEGRIDTNTSPELADLLPNVLGGVEELIIDIEEVNYVSSAGLRVLLSAQKAMNGKGKMIVKNVCEEVMEVFELTGFNEILTIC